MIIVESCIETIDEMTKNMFISKKMDTSQIHILVNWASIINNFIILSGILIGLNLVRNRI